MNRRSFFRGLGIGAASVAISLRMAQGNPIQPGGRYRWAEANNRYDYAIDQEHAWDVLVYDKRKEQPITVEELEASIEANSEPSVADPFDRAEMCAPIQPVLIDEDLIEDGIHGVASGLYTTKAISEPVTFFSLTPDMFVSEYQDDTELALEAFSIIAMSQASIGLKESGTTGFDGPWMELDDEITSPRIFTKGRDYYEAIEQERGRAYQ